ncbi:MAG TPA: tRNA preQ1(34) S-adenosylmethionine ribosyltransferase-isomerase QueA [Armatimonadota bacterium]
MKERVADYDYHLPPERIAQTPAEPRDASRLLVVHRDTGELEHRSFRDVLEYLLPGDVLVVNSSRVRAARIIAHRVTGGRVELLLLKPHAEGVWETLVSPGRKAPPGTRLIVNGELEAEVLDRTEAGGRMVRFSGAASLDDALERAGEVPLPPYITRKVDDPERYQTVYSRTLGSAAAPTAGLHFTPELLQRAHARGVTLAEVTLHIGLDTFRPVKVDDLDEHVMHSEWFEISPEAAEAVNGAAGRVIAVGTTSVRALESAAQGGKVAPGAMETRLFLRPGARFQVVDAMVTNFHLPKSTLLMLVSAFAGKELMKRAYEVAVQSEYRFFSFGDAMLIL